MKKLLIGSMMMLIMIATAGTSHAQVSVSVNINLQPDWGPVGYDYVEYYYIPQYEVYYYVPKHQFVYLDGGKWIFVSTLPPRFGHVDLYSVHKVVINEPEPYRHFDEHKVKYAKYKGSTEKQEVIRDSKDPKYVAAKKGNTQSDQKTPENKDQKAAPQKNDNNKSKDEKKDKHPDDKHPSDNQPK